MSSSSEPIGSDRYKYFQLLKEQYPTEEALCSEIGRISARLSLPKETEHFMSDIHGEYEAFTHIMNNCSGVIREKVSAWLGSQMTEAETVGNFVLAGVQTPKIDRMNPFREAVVQRVGVHPVIVGQ